MLKYGKIWAGKNSVFGHFLHRVLHAVFTVTWKAIQSANVQLCLRFTELNVMHGKSILELYSSLCRQNEIILNHFKVASITEAAESANTMLKRIKPF